MNIFKREILKNICYTELVYERINKKLNIKLSKPQIEDFIFKTLKETDEIFFEKIGKNFYVINDNLVKSRNKKAPIPLRGAIFKKFA